jgi:hypothetical protein
MPNQDVVIDYENLQNLSGWPALRILCLTENQLELLLRSATLGWRERSTGLPPR